MTGEDDTGNPARLPSLESGLPFRERGRLGKLPENATGPEWATMLKATGYGSGAWWQHKIARAIRQRDLNATANGIIRRAEMLCWLGQYDAVPDAWRTPAAPAPQATAEPAPVPQNEPDQPEQGAVAAPKPRLSDKEILALRQQGLSNEQIQAEYGISKHRITRINKNYGIERLTPGPKPKGSD